MEQFSMATFGSYLWYAPFAVEIFLIVLGANKIYDWLYGDSKVIVQGQLAMAVQRSGLSLGCVFAMVSAMDRVRFEDFWTVFGLVALWGTAATVSVILASFVNDKFITMDIDDREEIRNGNVPIAVVDSSAAFATGLITAGSFSGGAPLWVVGVFFVFGQIALVASARLYIRYAELEHQWFMHGNLAAAVSLGGMIIASGIILRNVLSGPFTGLAHDILGTVIAYVVGMTLLFAVVVFAPRLYFGTGIHGAVKDNNTAFAVFMAAVKIMLALTIGAVVIN